MTDEDALRAQTLGVMSAYQRLVAQKDWPNWIELWAEDGVLEFPFAPAGRRARYQGRADILAYMSGTGGKVAVDGVRAMRVLPAQDPRIAMVEMTIDGHAPNTGARYDQSYVLIFEVEDGRLKRYREYWNPLISINAQGGDRLAWAEGFGSPEPRA